MIKIRPIAVWQVALTAAMVLILSGQAQAVLTDFYNGATGDADPVSQGWVSTLFDLSGTSSVTPQPDEDRVHMLTSVSGLNKYKLQRPLPQSILDAISDDVYVWEVEAQLKSPELADADGEPRHTLNDWDFITGTNTGSVGFRDRFFFETTDYGCCERIRFTGTWFPTGNYSQTIRPHTAENPQPWTNFTSLYDRNVYRFERNGLGMDTVKFFINGDLVFQGAGGVSPIGSAQVEIRDNASQTTNLYWYRFSVDVDSGTGGMACDFNADSSCDVVDIDLLADAVRNGTTDLQFNVDGLGDPNIPDDADFDFYITDESMLGTGLGDHDLNMIVNFNDFVVLSNNFGATPTGWAQGNGNTDDITNFNDFVRLSNNFGLSFASGSNVPEPAAIGLLCVLAVVLMRTRPSSDNRP